MSNRKQRGVTYQVVSRELTLDDGDGSDGGAVGSVEDGVVAVKEEQDDEEHANQHH